MFLSGGFLDFQLMFSEIFFTVFFHLLKDKNKKIGVVGGIWRIGFRDFVILMSFYLFIYIYIFFLRNCSVFRMREYM